MLKNHLEIARRSKKLVAINTSVLLSVCLFVCISLTTIVGYAQISGKVVGITDGDTFTLLAESKLQVKVRLHGIDAPEKNQDFGQTAKKFLSDAIFNKTVWIKTKGNDWYGRTIGIVYCNANLSGASVNELTISSGYAWHFKKYDHNPAWAELEKQARKEGKGLWIDKNAIAPWDFRKNSRTKTATKLPALSQVAGS